MQVGAASWQLSLAHFQWNSIAAAAVPRGTGSENVTQVQVSPPGGAPEFIQVTNSILYSLNYSNLCTPGCLTRINYRSPLSLSHHNINTSYITNYLYIYTIQQCIPVHHIEYISCLRIFYIFRGDLKMRFDVSFPVDDTIFNITLYHIVLTLYRHVAAGQL